MKLTVALRVIGGFAIISLLLLLISGFSLKSLFSISGAAEEMNQLALPTLKGSSQLKVSFLEMGRLSVEAYYENNSEELQNKLTHFNQSKEVFNKEFATLRSVLNTKPALSSSLKSVDNIYQQFLTNVDKIFGSHAANLSFKAKLNDIVGNIEDNSDDASTLILDFQDLDEVQADSRLSQAAELGGELETSLLSLLTIALDYMETDTLVRAETVGNEVELISDQISKQITEMQQIADGRDSSGTLTEIEELVSAALSDVRASDGLLQTQLNSLNQQLEARNALGSSENNIQQASIELSKLLGQAEKLAFSAEEEMNDQVSGGTTLVIVIFLVAIVVAVGIAWASVRSITVPLAKVNDVLHVVSSGDLTQKLDDSSDDEFGELAESVNNLIDSLKSLISGISSRASQLAAASEQTSAVTTQTTASIQDQKSQVGQVAAATTEMHSTSQMVTQSADDTLNQIRHADSEAEKVKVISLENKRTIEVLAADVEEAAQVINKLHQDSASIGGILDVIRGVADQTNLLALNAAIEAARAGEQGRGFAVVADEVRTLASRTQESTQEINAMIEVLQAGAEKAVSVMNQGKEQTTVCVEQTEKATQALELITSAVHKAHDVSTQIEQSAREQNLVSQEISEKLENIVGIAEETASGAQQTSDSSLEVAKLAEELQGSIRQFKV